MMQHIPVERKEEATQQSEVRKLKNDFIQTFQPPPSGTSCWRFAWVSTPAWLQESLPRQSYSFLLLRFFLTFSFSTDISITLQTATTKGERQQTKGKIPLLNSSLTYHD
jgi:hypothetical protein